MAYQEVVGIGMLPAGTGCGLGCLSWRLVIKSVIGHHGAHSRSKIDLVQGFTQKAVLTNIPVNRHFGVDLTLGIMADENIYAGSFQVNGKCITQEVRSWIQSGLHVSAPTERFSTHLRVFNAAIFATLNEKSMGHGLHYVISGSDCALINRGPLGHPGDGEFDCWCAEKIDISFRYESMNLFVSLSFLSEKGSGGHSRAEGDLSPILMVIDFVVPFSKLKAYLQLSDSAWGFFQEKLSNHQRPKNA